MELTSSGQPRLLQRTNEWHTPYPVYEKSYHFNLFLLMESLSSSCHWHEF
uniref:Uncharacterized protein n=1 Tax=Setaria italica TaxID=4555 RepID=K3ZBU2_SETIT